MIEVCETFFSDFAIVQFAVSKDDWEKIQNSEEWKKIIQFDVKENEKNVSVEETLQSIDDAAKAIGCNKDCLKAKMRTKEWDLGIVSKPKKAGGRRDYFIFRAKLDKFLGLT